VRYSVWYTIALPVVLLAGAVIRGLRGGGDDVSDRGAG